MKPETIRLVRQSWRQVEAVAPAVAALFYKNLFEADPTLRPLFRSDMVEQGERLMRMLAVAVNGLDDVPALRGRLESLAERHVGYGVQEPHYATVGQALLKTLEQGLADGFTPAVQHAWTEVYAAIAEIMIAAARRAPQPRAGMQEAAHTNF